MGGKAKSGKIQFLIEKQVFYPILELAIINLYELNNNSYNSDGVGGKEA